MSVDYFFLNFDASLIAERRAETEMQDRAGTHGN